MRAAGRAPGLRRRAAASTPRSPPATAARSRWCCPCWRSSWSRGSFPAPGSTRTRPPPPSGWWAQTVPTSRPPSRADPGSTPRPTAAALLRLFPYPTRRPPGRRPRGRGRGGAHRRRRRLGTRVTDRPGPSRIDFTVEADTSKLRRWVTVQDGQLSWGTTTGRAARACGSTTSATWIPPCGSGRCPRSSWGPGPRPSSPAWTDADRPRRCATSPSWSRCSRRRRPSPVTWVVTCGPVAGAVLATLLAWVGILAVEEAGEWWRFAGADHGARDAARDEPGVGPGLGRAAGARRWAAGLWLVGFLWADLMLVPRLDPLVTLGDGWLLGEAVLLGPSPPGASPRLGDGPAAAPRGPGGAPGS